MAKLTALMRAEAERLMGKVGFAINQLLSRPNIPKAFRTSKGWRQVVLKPEQQICVELADRLRVLSKNYHETGKGLRAVWCHVANERAEAGKKESWLSMIILLAVGMIPGASDYWFVWENNGAVIEMKAGVNDLFEKQEYFETWCHYLSVKKAVHRRVDDAIQSLRDWGAIVD